MVSSSAAELPARSRASASVRIRGSPSGSSSAAFGLLRLASDLVVLLLGLLPLLAPALRGLDAAAGSRLQIRSTAR